MLAAHCHAEIEICANLPTEQRAYNSQTAGVTTAIVMAVLVPVAVASACLVWWMVKRVRRGKGEEEDYGGYDDGYNDQR